jgi:hypothetical protein
MDFRSFSNVVLLTFSLLALSACPRSGSKSSGSSQVTSNKGETITTSPPPNDPQGMLPPGGKLGTIVLLTTIDGTEEISTLNLGSIKLGQSTKKKIYLKNTGDVSISHLSLDPIALPFSLREPAPTDNIPACGNELAPQSICSLTIEFQSSSVDQHSQEMNIRFFNGQIQQVVSLILQGTGRTLLRSKSAPTPRSLSNLGLKIQPIDSISDLISEGRYYDLSAGEPEQQRVYAAQVLEQINSFDDLKHLMQINTSIQFSDQELASHEQEQKLRTHETASLKNLTHTRFFSLQGYLERKNRPGGKSDFLYDYDYTPQEAQKDRLWLYNFYSHQIDLFVRSLEQYRGRPEFEKLSAKLGALMFLLDTRQLEVSIRSVFEAPSGSGSRINPNEEGLESFGALKLNVGILKRMTFKLRPEINKALEAIDYFFAISLNPYYPKKMSDLDASRAENFDSDQFLLTK